MTILGLLLFVLGLVVFGLLAYWIITKFLPAQWHMIALAVVGVVLLIVLLTATLSPDILNQRVLR